MKIQLKLTGRSYHENVKERREKMVTTLHFVTISDFSGLDNHNMTIVIFHPLSRGGRDVLYCILSLVL